MPQLIFTASSVADLERLRMFLREKNPQAAKRATATIRTALEHLLLNPAIGRPLPQLAQVRELIIPFGDGGYVARYRFSSEQAAIYVLAIRHQKEVGL